MSSKSKRRERIKSGALIAGIDVAKRRHVAAIRFPDGTMQKPFSFSNDRVGFDKLLCRAEAARRSCGCEAILFALESSGHYGHALKHFLVDRGYSVESVNPAHTKKIKELEDNSPEKNDVKDSRIIADLVARGKSHPVTIPRGIYADLRRLGKLRNRLSVERTRWLNRYKGLVDLVFPELNGLVSDVACPSIRKLMGKCPSAVEISRVEGKELERWLMKWSIGHIRRERCRSIYIAAKESVGVKEGLETVRLEMRQTLETLGDVERRIAEVEEVQKDVVRRVPYAEQLLSIPRLGSVTLATILGETGDLRDYRNADAVIKLAGLNLYTISSGAFKGKTRITRRGRPLLRRYLYLAALRLVKQGGAMVALRDRLLPAKAKPQIAMAVCRKLIRVMMALVRDGTSYEASQQSEAFLEKAIA